MATLKILGRTKRRQNRVDKRFQFLVPANFIRVYFYEGFIYYKIIRTDQSGFGGTQ